LRQLSTEKEQLILEIEKMKAIAPLRPILDRKDEDISNLEKNLQSEKEEKKMIKQELEALKLKITQYESQNPFDTQIQTLTYEIEQTKSKLKKKSDKLKQLKSMKKNFEEKETHLQNLIKEYQTSLSRDDIDIKEREAKLNTLQHENDQLKKNLLEENISLLLKWLGGAKKNWRTSLQGISGWF